MGNPVNNAPSTNPSTRSGAPAYGSRGNSLRGFGVSILNHRKLDSIRDYAIRKSGESGLPGQVDGPRDAYRHALLAGELDWRPEFRRVARDDLCRIVVLRNIEDVRASDCLSPVD